jgi:hypothetical protein
MNTPFLGQVLPGSTTRISPALWDFLLVGGITLVLAAVIFIVVAVTRKGRQHRPRSKRGPEILRNTGEHFREEEAKTAEDDGQEQESPQRHRRKRRRRDHRPRNPTLAESGGLPPVRDPDTTPHPGL